MGRIGPLSTKLSGWREVQVRDAVHIVSCRSAFAVRPRLIRPGDPVFRVRTDGSITSVVAMFPFGLVKPLRYLKDEDIWQTRFLAPPDMADGTHTVRLILRDRQGRAFRESKTFVIASKPPTVRVRLDKTGSSEANRYACEWALLRHHAM